MKQRAKIIIFVILFVFLFWLVFIFEVVAKGIPNTNCNWNYIGDAIIADCGYKIVDGCPRCGKKIHILEGNSNEK